MFTSLLHISHNYIVIEWEQVEGAFPLKSSCLSGRLAGTLKMAATEML